MSFSDQEIEEFKTEAFELLEIAEKNLLALDEGAEYRPAFDSIFRCLHNLKGASGMMDMLGVQAHTHSLETILMSFKDANSLPKEHIDLFLRGIDAAKILLNGQTIEFDFQIRKSQVTPEAIIFDAPKDSETAARQEAQNEFFLECEEILDRVSDALQLIESNNDKKETLEALYRDIHSLKGSAYLFSYTTLGDIAHKIESSLEGLRDGTQTASKELLDLLFKSIEFIEREVESLKSNTKNLENEASLQCLLNNLESFSKSSDAEFPPIFDPISKPKKEIQNHTEGSQAQPKEVEGASSIRVSVSLLDNLMTLMGEMVLVRNQVIQFSSRSDDLEFLTLSKRLNVVTNEIQTEMMKTRMQPIGNILSKFNRVVRDLSVELKKDINVHLSGADTELDKSLLEAIKDPLTHIVRNSCDHGIELPEIRSKAGKTRSGTIHIRSFHEGGQVIIEIQDDGKGLHKEVILKKAIEKTIISESQAKSMSEKEVFNLIFAPGFSTAASITNVSGRGVGMDVVRTNVERIGGSVELSSESGIGTTTRLKIPLTLAIVPALIVKCGGGKFAIPQVKLEELVRVDQSSSENKIEHLHGAPVFRLRGNILPLVGLNQILSFATDSNALQGVHNIAVLNADQKSFGLIVDEILDTADIVVKPLNRLLKSLHVFSGATILGDGSIALILDVSGISKVTRIGTENSKEDEIAKRRKKDKEEIQSNEFQEYLLFKLNSRTKHAIVLGFVHRLEEFCVSKIEYSGSQKLIRYGEIILPLISVNQYLGLVSQNQESLKETISVIVIQKAGILYGLEVDEIIDTLSTDIEATPGFVKQVGVYGNLNSPQEIIIIIDPFELIDLVCPESKAPTEVKFGHSSGVVLDPEFDALQILLVEDTVFFRRAIARVLTNAGHQITMATNGKEALEFLEKSPKKFDLIVSDIEMPRMNGFQLAQSVRKNSILAQIPMLAISSRADKKYIDQGRNAGFDVYLEKLKPELLIDAVARLTSDKRKAG